MTNDRHFSVDVAYLADAASDVSKLLAWLKHLMRRRPAVTNDDTTPAGLIRRWSVKTGTQANQSPGDLHAMTLKALD